MAALTGGTERRNEAPPSDQVGSHARPSVAYLSYSWGEYDARSFRMARSAIRAGYRVTIYTRWHPGLPPVEEHDGYRLIRAPIDWKLAVPGLRNGARTRAAAAMAASARLVNGSIAVEAGQGMHADKPDEPEAHDQRDAHDEPVAAAIAVGDIIKDEAIDEIGSRGRYARRLTGYPIRLAQRAVGRTRRAIKRYWRLALFFPLHPLGWAAALESVVEPADIWHGMWAGSLPALGRMYRLHGGRTIYDSRDVYMMSRDFYRLGWPLRPILAALERRWAQAADRILTVNEHYADLLVDQLGIPRPVVVLNCPEAWTPPHPAPDLIRAALALPPETSIVLYQGALMGERGIEQAMDAILEVTTAVLVLLGFGSWQERLRKQVGSPPYIGRVFVLPAVPPGELLQWSASADVMVMPIQPTTVNHRFTTPQKLFEAIAAGVPVVASDLPGMASIVSRANAGILCDPTSPAAIAAAIRTILELGPDERARMRARILGVAHERYNWEAQVRTLFDVYRELAPAPATPARPAGISARRSP